MKKIFLCILILIPGFMLCQETPSGAVSKGSMEEQVNALVDKKAEYNKLTGGVQDGYRIKIHFGVDRDAAEAVRIKFSGLFPDVPTDKDYQQPYFVILVGSYKTKLEAFESHKKIQAEFPNAFIVKAKIKMIN